MLAIALLLPVLVYATLRVEGCSRLASSLFATAVCVRGVAHFLDADLSGIPDGVIAAGVIVLIGSCPGSAGSSAPGLRYTGNRRDRFVPWLNIRFVVLAPISSARFSSCDGNRIGAPSSSKAESCSCRRHSTSCTTSSAFGRLRPTPPREAWFVRARTSSWSSSGSTSIACRDVRGTARAPPDILGMAILVRRHREGFGLLVLALYLAVLVGRKRRTAPGR